MGTSEMGRRRESLPAPVVPPDPVQVLMCQAVSPAPGRCPGSHRHRSVPALHTLGVLDVSPALGPTSPAAFLLQVCEKSLSCLWDWGKNPVGGDGGTSAAIQAEEEDVERFVCVWDGDNCWERQEKRKWSRAEQSQTEAGAWGCVGVGEHPAELDWLCQNPGNCSDSTLALHIEPCSRADARCCSVADDCHPQLLCLKMQENRLKEK